MTENQPSSEHGPHLHEGLLNDPITRRQLLVRGSTLALSATAVGSLLSACGSSGPSPSSSGTASSMTSSKDIENFAWAMVGAPRTLDIATGDDTYSCEIMGLGLEAALAFNNDLTVRPSLAESWSESDPLHYVFKLRKGVTFWDGTPLTAEDLQYSMSRHLDPSVASQISGLYGNVKAVEVTGPDEVTVRMKQPDPTFPLVAAVSFVTPKAFSQRLGKQLGVPGSTVNTMGTGAYRITSFDTAQGATVERNESYWGQRPKVRKATIHIITNPQTVLLALQSGSIQGTDQFSLDLCQSYSSLPKVTTYYPPALSVMYLSFDVTSPPWNDIHVRRAVAYAADLAGYVHAFLGGHGQPASAIVPPAQWADLAPSDEVNSIYSAIPRYDYDLSKAKQELAASAYPNGFSAQIESPSSLPYAGRALVSLSVDLKTIGIKLKVNEVPLDKWIADLYTYKVPLLLGGLSPDFSDPADYMLYVYPSDQARVNGLNTAHFKNQTVDNLLVAQARATDKADRIRKLQQVLAISGEQLPYLPLWWMPSTFAINNKYVYSGANSLFYYGAWLGTIGLRA